MKQPDTQREGPAQKLDQDAAGEQPMGGREATTSGGGATAQHNKTSNKQTKQKRGGSPTTQEAAHKGQREDNRKNAGRKTHRPKTTQRSHSKKGNKEKTTNKQRARKARPKTTKTGVPEGDRTTNRQAKEAPQDNSKWEQVTKRCQGKSGTGGRRTVKEIVERERGA